MTPGERLLNTTLNNFLELGLVQPADFDRLNVEVKFHDELAEVKHLREIDAAAYQRLQEECVRLEKLRDCELLEHNAEVDKLRDELRLAAETNSYIRNELVQLRRDPYKDVSQNCLEVNDQLQLECSVLHGEIAKSEMELVNRDKEMNQLHAEIVKRNEIIHTLKTQIELLETLIKADPRDAEIERLREQVRDLEAYHKPNIDLRSEITELRAAVATWKQGNLTLRRIVEDQQEELVELRRKVGR